MNVTAFRRRERLEAAYIEWMWRSMARDAETFFSYLFIPSQRDPRGREEFQLFDHQREDLQVIRDNRFVVILKARQLGLSTLVMAYVLWVCLFQPGSTVLWMSKNQDAANKALQMLKVMWQFLPQWMRDRAPDVESESTKHMTWKFADGMTSTVKCFAATKTAGAGETATIVVLDEMALYESPEETYRTAIPTTDAGGQLLIVSTARGAYNRFATLYKDAKRGLNRFAPIFHPWWVSAFVDEATYEAKRQEFAAEPWLFHAEYPSSEEEAFRESGRPRFASLPAEDDCEEFPLRGELAENEWGDVVLVESETGPLRLTYSGEDPDRRRDYVLAVDPATGQGMDFTAAHVLAFDAEGEPEVVAYWHANDVEQVEVARRLDVLGRHFAGPHGPALLIPEKVGGWADALINELQHLSYPRIYVHKLTGHRRRAATTTFGFPMTANRRPLVIDKLAEYVVDRPEVGPKLACIHPLLRQELATFVRRDDGKVAADVGCHDDLVMSVAIALWVLLEEGGVATDDPIGEGPVHDPNVYDLSHIFQEAERVQAAVERDHSRMIRRWADRQRRATSRSRR